MVDDYTPYDDVYMPINVMTEYEELKQLLDRWIESLDDADKNGYNTHKPRVYIERIKNILCKMDHIAMHTPKNITKPWEVLGISEATYYYRRKKQFNGIPLKPWEEIGISRSTYYRDQRRSRNNDPSHDPSHGA